MPARLWHVGQKAGLISSKFSGHEAGLLAGLGLGHGLRRQKRSAIKPIRRHLHSILASIPAYHVPLIRDRYPEVRRKEFARLTDDDIQKFHSILRNDTERVITDESTLETYSCDWLKALRGESPLLLFPETSEELSNILKHCYHRNLAVVPQGGNTSMVGGSIPIFDEIIVNTKRMKDILLVDDTAGVVMCEAGCSLQELDYACSRRGLYFPMDYHLREALIGGVLAADMGGPRTVRYGTLHGNVLGLEVVLADGKIVDLMSTVKKDNTGTDLKNLFIGSEGTLGIITKAAMSCPTRPKKVCIAVVSCETYDDIMKTFKIARDTLSEIISAVEFYDAVAVNSLKKSFLSLWGIPNHPFTVMIETCGTTHAHDEDKLETFMERVKEQNVIVDGTIATAPDHIEKLWGIYNSILISLVTSGYVHQFDVSLPHHKIYECVEYLRKELGDTIEQVVGYGHLLDGNLDLSIVARQYNSHQSAEIKDLVYSFVAKYNGAISSELGCGFKFRNLSHYSKGPVELKLEKMIKDVFDPKGILNPYKVLPDE